jgi:type II secretion system (T2SS) protein E
MANKLRLGDLLVKDGLIRESDLRTMLAQQKQHGGRLGEHLVRVNLCTEEQIAHALARQLAVPFNDLTDPPAPAVSKIIPKDKAFKYQALAMGQNPFAPRLPVAFADPTDVKATMEVEKAVGRPIQVQCAPALLLRRAIESAYLSLDLRDEGTSEFQVTGLGGQVRSVQVRPQQQAAATGYRVAPQALEEEEAPDAEVLTTGELEPIPEESLEPLPEADNEAGEEALRMVWALADLMVERGLISRSELTRKLRAR